jgi:hypothetical protein
MRRKRTSIFLFLSWMISITASAKVQRSVNSSYKDFLQHLQKTEARSFVDSYIQLSSVTELEAPLLEKCLEEMYLGAPSAGTCFDAVKSLTSRPLNQPRREVLFSFLRKLEKQPSPHQSFYREMKAGLLQTHPALAKTFGLTLRDGNQASSSPASDLEMNAWRKALLKKFPLEEAALLINGLKVAKLKDWKAPAGVFQWVLVSNTHEPVVRIGTFSKFAAESLQNMKSFADVSCKDLKDLNPPQYGLLQVEVFVDSKCFRTFGSATAMVQRSHLGNSQKLVKIESESSRHWVWPALAVVTVGLAHSLKGKQVTVEWPSLNSK